MSNPVSVPDNVTDQTIERATEPFLGAWNRLVSTTNWEKGRIICDWREELIAQGADVVEYSDEAWSRRVGSVSSQHVGRLRRVYRRFAHVREQYEGLYWSHFQAALDWNDAEMWLEGAVSSRWSVSQMRNQRWETLGAPDELKPREEDIVVAELDEDAGSVEENGHATAMQQVRDPGGADGALTESDVDDQSHEYTSDQGNGDGEPPWEGDEAGEAAPQSAVAQRVRPFENLAALPDDLTDAFESFKLAILRHKTGQWDEVSPDDVLATLDALKELVLAPSAE
jgi:hypothetical protein